MKLKDKFTFNYQNQVIQVEKIGEVYCAIFPRKNNVPIAKPLKIEIYEDNKHKGKISNKEGKFLSFIPSHAIEGNEEQRISNTELIKKHSLPLFCEICLNNDKTVLEVHHIKEHAITLDNSKDNLRVYCSSCHSLVHNIRTIQRRTVRRFKPELTREEFDKQFNNNQ